MPDVFEIRFDFPGGKDQPDTDKGHADHGQSQAVPLLLQEQPGEQGQKDGVGHVEDVAFGQGGQGHCLIEAHDRQTVEQGSADEQIVSSRGKPLTFDHQQQTDGCKPQEKAEEGEMGGIVVHLGPGPADNGCGQIETEGGGEYGQPAEKDLEP